MAPDVAAKAGIQPVTLEELWAKADYITLHTPKTPVWHAIERSFDLNIQSIQIGLAGDDKLDQHCHSRKVQNRDQDCKRGAWRNCE
jgi:hypothetical protein